MKLNSLSRRLVTASCLSLLLSWQAAAVEQIQQPTSVDRSTASKISTAQDYAVTPAGCCDDSCDSCSGGGSGCCGGSNGCCGGNCCCEAVCCPKKVTEEVKKHCWLVKPELVCIPGFRFECNWGKSKRCQSGCCAAGGCDDACCGDGCGGDSCCGSNKCCCNDPGKPTCGRVRCINVLEKHEYTCDKCGYEWEAKCVRSGRGGTCRGKGSCCVKSSGCSKGSCCCPSCGCAAVEAATDLEPVVQLTSASKATPAKRTSAVEPSLSRRLISWLK